MNLFCLLFDDYETLDLMGPVEFLARVPGINLNFVSFNGKAIKSKQGFGIKTKKLVNLPNNSILLVPGGQGTRILLKDNEFISHLKGF